jgi:UDP:flavonoid glycosyltransferase YjiC (YdhE family)
MKYLFIVQASFGHLLPALRLAELVLERGHEALFVASDQYSALLDQRGLQHLPVTNTGHPFLSTYDWYDPGTVGIQVRLLGKIVERYRPDVLVTGPLGLATFMIAELRSLPVLVLGYGEFLYPGVGDDNPTRWWRLRTVTSFYNQCRKEHGLEPIEADPETTPLLGDCYLSRNVPEFTTPAELPARVRHVGGLYWEPAYRNPRMERFVRGEEARGRRRVYVQIGRLFDKTWVWARLMNVLDELGVACVADTGRADYLDSAGDAFPSCFQARFVPVGSVAAADAVICSGHTAVILGAITHRKPLLCIPTSADADECAERVAQCGLGAKIHYKTEFNADSFQRFFDRVDRGEFRAALARFSGHLEAWKRAERSLGDIGATLGEPRRDERAPVDRGAAPQL